jgi:transcriptional regulator with PAS, ATPase and Fis domain
LAICPWRSSPSAAGSEEKTFRRVGGNKLIEVDVRIIAATNKNLKELIEQKLFREDLFYRLSVIRINIPPFAKEGTMSIFLQTIS